MISAPHEEAPIKSVVYGGLDGIITTFAVVAGVAGASLEPSIVLILGFANLIADGFSMATGDYLSTKAKKELVDTKRETTKKSLDENPHGKRDELVSRYQGRGLSKHDAETVASIMVKHKGTWVDELGLAEDGESPLWNGLVTFFSFVAFGVVPLLVYVASWFGLLASDSAFAAACFATAATLFLLGALKTRFTEKNILSAGLETMLVGGIAAFVAYGIGHFLSSIV